MPKVIPEEVKMKAMELFMEGKTVPVISKMLFESFATDVKVPTIYAWVKQYKWKDTKQVARADAVAVIKETETQRFARLQQEHLTDYEKLRKKASAELDGNLFDRPFEAARALDLGIKGERSVMEGMINLQFIQDVLNILVEEVNDEDAITRIASKLKLLVVSNTKD